MLKEINIIPKWVVFAVDLLICYFSFLFAHFLKNNLSFKSIDLHTLSGNIIVLLIVFSISFYSFKTYKGIIRHTGFQDTLKVIYTVLSATAILFFLSLLSTFFGVAVYFSAVMLVLNMFFCFLFLVSYRFSVKFALAYFQLNKLDKKNVIIYGAGDEGLATKRVLEHDYRSNINIVAFLDDDNRKISKVVDGIKIHNTKELERISIDQSVDEIIIADFSINRERKADIVDFCLDHNIKVLSVPPINSWIDGEFSPRQLRSFKIENLLEREPIKLSNEILYMQVNGKSVLVTGAAGSIGSEITRQLLKYSPAQIILCDQAETPLNHLVLELAKNKTYAKCIPFLCDITNLIRVKELYDKYKPDYVYHAAAYKHVPMMEISATEAILNNVLGTKILADLAFENNIKAFVLVSTDKAVNPTNIMGASKRLAEMYIQKMHWKSILNNTQTKYIITRFGNVLGTNGSVVNIFQEQIESGGPVTVTHPEITRYFMTVAESCQLVLEAGSMGKGGEVFVFDMGDPVAIIDLARKMIKLYGLIPDIDIEVEYSGLRPGEKLYEELWTSDEELLPTHHQKITIARENYNNKDGDIFFDQLFELARNSTDEIILVRKMKELVPGFISNNSIFGQLD